MRTRFSVTPRWLSVDLTVRNWLVKLGLASRGYFGVYDTQCLEVLLEPQLACQLDSSGLIGPVPSVQHGHA